MSLLHLAKCAKCETQLTVQYLNMSHDGKVTVGIEPCLRCIEIQRLLPPPYNEDKELKVISDGLKSHNTHLWKIWNEYVESKKETK